MRNAEYIRKKQKIYNEHPAAEKILDEIEEYIKSSYKKTFSKEITVFEDFLNHYDIEYLEKLGFIIYTEESQYEWFDKWVTAQYVEVFW